MSAGRMVLRLLNASCGYLAAACQLGCGVKFKLTSLASTPLLVLLPLDAAVRHLSRSVSDARQTRQSPPQQPSQLLVIGKLKVLLPRRNGGLGRIAVVRARRQTGIDTWTYRMVPMYVWISIFIRTWLSSRFWFENNSGVSRAACQLQCPHVAHLAVSVRHRLHG